MLLEGVGVVGETSLWRGRDLNPQPTAYESVALPIELPRHYFAFRVYHLDGLDSIYNDIKRKSTVILSVLF
jgi:hypothetical protein